MVPTQRSPRTEETVLYHHDSRDYNEAASEAAKFARTKMERKIEEGRASAERMLHQVLTVIPEDNLVDAHGLKFRANGTVRMAVDGQRRNAEGQLEDVSFDWDLHPNALNQVAQRADMPLSFVKKLLQPAAATKKNPNPTVPEWKRELLAHNLDEIYSHRPKGTKYLVRSVNDQARGFLSANYRRIDSRPVIEAFMGACQEYGAVLLDGIATDTRVAVKAMLPMVFEPVPNEVTCFGMQFENSDFGVGALYCRPFMWRLWCTNRATLEDAIAQIHLGKRMTNLEVFSEETIRLDLETHISAVKDVTRRYLSPEKIAEMCATIKTADENEVEWKDVNRNLLNHLTKEEQKEAQEMFESDKVEIETLPQAKSEWRLSNIFSYLAGKSEDADRKMELERVAGRIIDTTAKECGVYKEKEAA